MTMKVDLELLVRHARKLCDNAAKDVREGAGDYAIRRLERAQAYLEAPSEICPECAIDQGDSHDDFMPDEITGKARCRRCFSALA